MITYHNGDLLKSKCEIIAHQCNLQGVFGGGIAYQIKKKFPDVEKHCQKGINNLGDVIMCDEVSEIIANCFSQTQNFMTDYEAIKTCFKKIRTFALNNNIKTIGVPYYYGCGIATGDWETVKEIFIRLFRDCDEINFQIWRI